MALRVNQNVMALTTHRNLMTVDWQLAKSIERLSSGLRVNRASDDPAVYVQSEKMRTTIAGINQAITNLTDAISLTQTVEGAYDEIESLLRNIRTLALHAANTGPNDTAAIENDQVQIQNAINSIDMIAVSRKYGSKVLLDGNIGKTGLIAPSFASDATVGATILGQQFININFLKAGLDTLINKDIETRGIAGTLIAGTVYFERGSVLLPQHWHMVGATFGGVNASIAADETLTINGVKIELVTGDNALEARDKINRNAAITGVSAYVVSLSGASFGIASTGAEEIKTENSLAAEAANSVFIRLMSRQSGADFTIDVSSTRPVTEPETSGYGTTPITLSLGKDIDVTMNLVYARASGAVYALTTIAIGGIGKGAIWTPDNGELTLNIYQKGYTKITLKDLTIELTNTQNLYRVSNAVGSINSAPTMGEISSAGYLDGTAINGSVANFLTIRQSAVNFQIGPEKSENVNLSVGNVQANALGNTGKLSDIDVRSIMGAQNALQVADEALAHVLQQRGAIGAFQKNFLESTKGNMLIYRENYTSAESQIRDTDMAMEMISFTRHQILMQSGTAMLAQANLAPQSVLQLLR